MKLNPLAEWTEDEVWDYLRDNDVPTHALYAAGYTSIGCAPCTRPVAAGEPVRAGRWWWETGAPKECGMHCSIETGGFEHELHAILGSEGRVVSGLVLAGEERNVAVAELRAVRSAVRDGEYAETLDGILSTLERGDALDGAGVDELDRVIAIALQSGRVRALYGPGGEQAALRAYRKLPSGTELSACGPRGHARSPALAGPELESVSVTAVGPGAFTLSLAAGGAEISIRLDRQGARLASVGV